MPLLVPLPLEYMPFLEYLSLIFSVARGILCEKQKKGVSMKKLSFILVLIVAALQVFSAEIRGRVVGVADGDTVTVLDEMDNGRFRIRLYGIDSPEKKQAYGNKAKQYLSSLVYGKRVSVRFSSLDRYGRILGRLYLSGEDISLLMLSAGYAWHYRQYDNSLEYAAAEKKARSARCGLWSDPAPVPPWIFRRRGK